MIKTEGVLHFTIPVKNLDRAEKFYTELLGFEKVGRTERIVFLRAGDNFFNLTYSENPITLNAAPATRSTRRSRSRRRPTRTPSSACPKRA